MALAVDRGWLPEKRKWGLLLDTSEIFGVDAPDGKGLAGSVTMTRYGTGHASAGMMLVAARYGRQGLGRTIMTHLLTAAGDATVTLFATSLGRPLYEKLGFKPTGRSTKFTGHFRPGAEDPAIQTRPATDSDLPAILALDLAAFGADRSHILRRLPGFAEKIIVSLTPHGTSSPPPLATGSGVAGPEISGFAAAWANGPTTVIGPVIAPDDTTARRLITDLATQARGQVRLDVDPDRPELPAWLRSRGLDPGDVNTVMAYGPWDPPGNRSRIYTPITVAMT